MRSTCVHRKERNYGPDGPEDDAVEPVAALANEVDTTEAYRENRLHCVQIAYGFAGSYLLEGRRDEYRIGRVACERFDRLLQAFEALTDEQRTALELGPARMAALAMLDELRGLYATGELATARRMNERVLRDLEDAFGAVTPHGEAKLGRPIVRAHGELGRLCERAFASLVYDPAEGLGRVRQLFQVAADLDGGERTALETRPDLGRRTAFASLATVGFEMIALPYGVVHPTQWAAVAARLGLSIEDARARLYPHDDDSDEPLHGPRGHAAALGDELLVHAIPVIPEEERPRLYFPPSGPHAGTTEIQDPLTELYASLRGYLERYRRYAELGAGEILMDIDSANVQRIVDRIAAATTPLDVSTIDGWGAKPPRDRVRLAWSGDDESGPSDTPPTCVWMTEDRIAVCIEDVAQIISITNKRVVHDFATSYARLQACDDSGRYLITTAYGLTFDTTNTPFDFGCYDTEAKTWLTELPAHIPAVTFGKDQPEDGVLFELRRDESYAVGDGDRPTAMCWSHGNRAVLLSGDYAGIQGGGIRSTITCMEEVAGKALEARVVPVPVLAADGTLAEPDEDEDQDEGEYPMYEAVPCAIARTGESWRVLLPSRHIADLGHTHFQIGYPIRAASFAPGGRRLALVTEDELQVVDLADRAIVWRYALST